MYVDYKTSLYFNCTQLEDKVPFLFFQEGTRLIISFAKNLVYLRVYF